MANTTPNVTLSRDLFKGPEFAPHEQGLTMPIEPNNFAMPKFDEARDSLVGFEEHRGRERNKDKELELDQKRAPAEEKKVDKVREKQDLEKFREVQRELPKQVHIHTGLSKVIKEADLADYFCYPWTKPRY